MERIAMQRLARRATWRVSSPAASRTKFLWRILVDSVLIEIESYQFDRNKTRDVDAMPTRLAATILLPLLCLATARKDSEQLDPIAKALEVAKDNYKKDLEKARDLVYKSLDEAEKKAIELADITGLKSIKAERNAFKLDGTLPKLVSTSEFQKQCGKLQKSLDEAYKIAIRDYLRADKIGEAEKVEKEREELSRERPSAKGAPQVRPVAPPETAPALRDPGMAKGFGEAKFDVGEETVRGTTVKVGNPQFTLIWDSKADLDLYVMDPSGKTVWWNDKRSAAGGFLDVDNTDGFGPENAAWTETGFGELPPEGEYRWSVRYYGGNNGIPTPTRWRVRVKCGASVEVIEGSLSNPRDKSRDYSTQFRRK